MALSTNTVWEVRVAGSGSADTNGGGYVTGAAGTDYSQQDAPQYTFANLASSNGTNASPVVSSASHNFVTADIGNLLHITAGTSWTAGWYEIKSVSGNNATLDRACATSASVSSGTYAVGGAVASPAIAAGVVPGSGNNIIYIKAGTYTITTASTNVTGGCLNSTAMYGFVVGYSTNRTILNHDTKPVLVLNAGVSAATIFQGNGANLIIDGNNQTTSRGCYGGTVFWSVIRNCTNYGINSGLIVSCELYGCSGAGYAAGAQVNAFWCVAHNNSVPGFYCGTGYRCIAYNNTASGFFIGTSLISCISYHNTGSTTDGFQHNSSGFTQYLNCVAEANGRYGFNGPELGHFYINCSHYGNGTAGAQATSVVNLLAPSASVFVDGSNQDFRLNNTAGAGALLRGAGYAAWPAVSGSMASYPDIGAAQHQDVGGDGGGGISRGRML